MKIANKYFKPLSLLAMLALMVVSCTEFKEFESKTYGPGPTVTLALASVQDSSFTVSVTSSADGFISIILLPGMGNTPPEDPEDLLTGNVNAMDYQTKKVPANTTTHFTFSGLVQYAAYEVMAAANDANDVPGDIATLAVGTDDTHPPMLAGTDPGVGYSPSLAVGGPVVLVFDEPVIYDTTKHLVFSEFYDGQDVDAGSVSVDYNVVTVTPGEDFTNLDYAMLSYPEGAFVDYAGNLTPEVQSYFDGVSQLVGLYWGVESKTFEPLSVTPDEGAVAAGFDIVVTFAEMVDISDVADGDITLTYDDGLDVLIKAVLASEVSAAGNELTITQSYSAAPGVKVTLTIPAELLSIGYGNPNAEVIANWTILHPLQAWIGDYTINAVSYSDPGNYDEVWAASVAPVAGDLTHLAITIDAGGGGGVPFLAAFDSGSGTITIPSGTDVGDLYGYGSILLYVGDFSNPTPDMVSDIAGTIDPDGTILIDQVAVWFSDYAFYYDAFNTTWTQSAKKSASWGTNYDAKLARIK